MGSMEHRTALASGKLHEDHIKLEPDMREVTPLDRIDFACHTVRKLTSQRILVRMVLSRQLLVVEAPEMSDGRYTIIQIEVQEPVNGYPFVKADDTTGIYLRDPSWTTAPGAVELCSGMGFVSQAAEYIGFKVFCKVELQAVTAAALGHLGEQVVHGDVSEIETVRAVLDEIEDEDVMAILCANCQPFSRYGDRRGLQDTRARSLTGGLRLAYLIQAWTIVMENVKGTFDFPGVMAILNQYVLLHDWEWNKLDMDLAQQWTSKRERTWALLAPAWMGVSLLPWPTLASPPPPSAWGALDKQWSEEDEQELLLTPEEIALYLDDFQGQNFHVENMTVLPTALHSLGTILQACLCGCRTYPISRQRLQDRGLSGLLTKRTRTGWSRFVHPRELALWMGIALPPGRLSEISPLRFWLGQLGQSASPLQGAWILGQVAEKVMAFAPHLGLINAEDALMMTKQAAIASWRINGESPPLSMRRVDVQYRFWSFYDQELDQPIAVTANAQTTQAEVVAAECRLQGYKIPRNPHLVDITGFAVEADGAWPASPMSLRAERNLDRVYTNQTTLEVKQSITTQALEKCTMLPGARLFDALREMNLPVEGVYVDKYGKTWHLDELLGLCPIELTAHKVNNEVVQYGGVLTDAGEWLEIYPPTEHYVEWRMHLIHTNGFAMGHDEVWMALQQLQTWEGVPCLPPLRMMNGRLQTMTGQPISVQVPTEAVGMILKDQHWVGFRLLHVQPYWTVQLYGCPPESDLPAWGRMLKVFLPGYQGVLRTSTTNVTSQIPHGCGFEALASLFVAAQMDLNMEPLQWTIFTGLPGLDSLIRSHLTYLDRQMRQRAIHPRLNRVVLQVRALFLQHLATMVPNHTINIGGVQPTPPLSKYARGRELDFLYHGMAMAQDEMIFAGHYLDSFPRSAVDTLEEPLGGDYNDSEITFLGQPWHVTKDMNHWVPVVWHGHWTLIMVYHTGNTLHVTIFHPLDSMFTSISEALQRFWGNLQQPFLFESGTPGDEAEKGLLLTDLQQPCGIQLIVMLAHRWHIPAPTDEHIRAALMNLTQWTLDLMPQFPFDNDRATLTDEFYHWGAFIRINFATACSQFETPRALIHGLGVLSQAHNTQLTELFQNHGVPDSAIQARIQQTIQALTPTGVVQALDGRWPWAALKQKATTHALRLVLPQELQTQIEKRKALGPGVRKAKQPRIPAPLPNVLPLDQFELPPDQYKDEDHQDVPVVAITQIKAGGTGIAMATASQVTPLLHHGQLSNGALAILTHGVAEAMVLPQHDLREVRMTLVYMPTGEKVLVTLQLLQMGKKAVTYQPKLTQAQWEDKPTIPVKLQWFRDEINLPWDQIVRNPVKTLLQTQPTLTECTTATCKCGAWHSEDAGVGLFLGIFDRQWLGSDYKRSSPAQAKIFCVTARVPLSAMRHIQTITGQQGFYAEPRATDQRTPHPDFAVQWLPGRTLAETTALKTVHPEIVGVARVGTKYGVRTAATDMPTLYAKLCPGDLFVPENGRRTFEIYPLPWGSTKRSVQGLLNTWKWPARPMTTMGSTTEGIIWMVATLVDPPSDNLAVKDTVILVKETTKNANNGPRKPAQLVASAKTWSHLKATHQEGQTVTTPTPPGTDQLFTNDPWAVKPPTPMQAHKTVSFDPTWQKYLDQKIDSKLARTSTKPQTTPAGDDVHMEDVRISKMEKDIAELQRVASTQTKETQALRTEVKDVVKEVQTVKDSFASELQKQLAEQMQQLSKLVSR